MNKSLALIAAACAACLSLGAYADDTTTTTVTTTTIQPIPAPTMTTAQAHDAKIQANAKYAADKKEADARLALAKADCRTNSDGAVERACKKDAKAQAKKDKAEAKLTKETTKSDINAVTQ